MTLERSNLFDELYRGAKKAQWTISMHSQKKTYRLTNNQVIVDQAFSKQYNKRVGDSFNLHTTTSNQTAVTIPAKIVGIVADTGIFAQTSGVMLLSIHDYQAAAPSIVLTYNAIDITTNHVNQASSAIGNKFPLANVQTADQALKSTQDQVSLINKFLEIAGLLALLIGGVGIVNTMQVLLSRRRIEIAMLKTVGYRRFDLYLLFGLEAGLLGHFVFKSAFGVSWYIAVGLIVGIALLAMITATLVAWGAVRVRPLEVLRYE
jgi:ABC-type antimicrobial peptide transport system permease subunit